MKEMKRLLDWLKERYNRIFFRPIDATRHLSGEQLGFFLEISSRRDKPLINEVTLWEEAESRAYQLSKKTYSIKPYELESKQSLLKRLKAGGIAKPELVDILVDKNSVAYKQDGSVDVKFLVEEADNDIRQRLTKKSKYLGVGKFRNNHTTSIVILFGQ